MTLGTLLVESGVLAPERLEEAMAEHRRTGDRLEAVLLRLGLVRREDLLRTFAQRLHLPIVDLADAAPDPETLRLLPRLRPRHNLCRCRSPCRSPCPCRSPRRSGASCA